MSSASFYSAGAFHAAVADECTTFAAVADDFAPTGSLGSVGARSSASFYPSSGVVGSKTQSFVVDSPWTRKPRESARDGEEHGVLAGMGAAWRWETMTMS